ncbi:MAG: tetratricopeptide repeat protein [Acidobacteriota bacterium]
MKKCPQCSREYDLSMSFCLDDGAELLYGPVQDSSTSDEPKTAILYETTQPNGASTRAQIHTTNTPIAGADSDRSARSGSGTKLSIAVAAILVVLGVGFFGYRYFSARVQINSIAVMPFVNESGNPDVEYLSDGMTETLISSLSQLPNLNVQARSSVFRYKGKDTDAKAIGRELNVQAILNGRVVQHGDDLVLYLELVDAQTGKQIWGDQYNRKQTDLVTLQSEIARDVSSKLKSKLSGADAAKVEKNYTANPEAYQLYLKGRFYWNKRTAESLKQAVEFFNQAIEKDLNYALAYSGLAESYVLFPNFSAALPMDCMPKAKAAAVRAIEIDDSLAEAHTALAIYYSDFSWNQLSAEKEFRRAIELNPNYPNAHHQFAAECLVFVRRFDEAIAEGKRAEELDPISPMIGADLGRSFTFARRFDDAIAQFNRVIALDPNFYVSHYYLGITFHAKGLYADAIAEYRKAAALNDDPWVRSQLARSLARSGQRDEALRLLGELQSESAHRYVSNASLALVYGALGDKDKAFALLEKEVAERTPRSMTLSVNPLWDDLRDDPRFVDLIRRIEASKMD